MLLLGFEESNSKTKIELIQFLFLASKCFKIGRVLLWRSTQEVAVKQIRDFFEAEGHNEMKKDSDASRELKLCWGLARTGERSFRKLFKTGFYRFSKPVQTGFHLVPSTGKCLKQ